MNKILLFLLINFIAFGNEPEMGDVLCSSQDCYTIIKSLGRGSFGRVFEVKNEEGTPFALKWYRSNKNSLRGVLDLYRDVEREYRIGQLLNHPNIIRSIETFEGNFNVLEFVKGESLMRTPRGSLNEEQVFTLALQLVSTLKFALSCHLMNWDLHAGNVMIDENKELKIIDLASFVFFHEIESIYHDVLTPHLIQNVDDIAELCIKIISKGNLPRKRSIFFKAEIKKLIWNYEADYEEGKFFLIEDCLGEVINKLEFCFSNLEANATHL